MPNSSTIYRIDCDMSHDEIKNRIRSMSYNETTSRGTILNTSSGQIKGINEEIFLHQSLIMKKKDQY